MGEKFLQNCSEEDFFNKIKIIKENFLNLIYTHSKNKS